MPSVFKKISTLLNRDVKSFFPLGNSDGISAQQPLQIEQVPTPCSQPQVLLTPVHPPPSEPLPLILNTSDLIRIQRRRVVLDWRDNSVLSVQNYGKQTFSRFSGYIDTQLDSVSILGKVFPDKAREVLTVEFNHRVLTKLQGEAQRSVENISAQVASWESLNNPKPQLAYQFRFSHLSCLGDLGFKPSNRDEILTLLEEHVIGEQGLICALQHDIADFANKLIRKILL